MKYLIIILFYAAGALADLRRVDKGNTSGGMEVSGGSTICYLDAMSDQPNKPNDVCSMSALTGENNNENNDF